MTITVNNFRNQAPDFLYFRLSNGRNALIDAPPGLGKTRAAVKVGVRLVGAGQRVLILEPTKTLRSYVVSLLKGEDANLDVHESKGMSDYLCPVIGGSVDPSMCTAKRDTCHDDGLTCDVMVDQARCRDSRLTVATHARFLLSKSQFSGYDTIIIDESHGFENAERSFLQTHISLDRLEKLASEIVSANQNVAASLTNLANGLRRLSDRVGDSTPLDAKEIELIKSVLENDNFSSFAIECGREGKFMSYRHAYSAISSLHYRMQNIYDNLFFFYEGSLLGRPKNMASEVAKFFTGKNVALLSATIGDGRSHGVGCGIDMKRFNDSSCLILNDYPSVRRKNRLLISLKDTPNLSKSEGRDYDSVRAQANEILLRILSYFELRTLVLFRSYNDHRSARSFLGKYDVVNRILDIEQGEDPESIEDKISKLRTSNIVLTSASSRLWEGVDVPGLRLVIIDALPYPSKDPLDPEYNFSKGYQAMLKRLKQGLGRIVRSDSDWGAAIVIDNRFDKSFKSLTSHLPWFMGEDFKRLTADEAIAALSEFTAARKS